MKVSWEPFEEIAISKTAHAEMLQEATSFLAFKIAAVNAARTQLLQLSDKGGSAVIEQESISDGLNRVQQSQLVIDDNAAFRVRVFVDLYLFELSSVRDAVLQIVNIAFALGLAEEDVKLATVLPKLRNVVEEASSCLEEWKTLANGDSWLSRLIDMRNQTTHRNLVSVLPTQEIQVGGPSATRGHVRFPFAITDKDGKRERLAAFMDRVEGEMENLLKSTSVRLARVLHSNAPRV